MYFIYFGFVFYSEEYLDELKCWMYMWVDWIKFYYEVEWGIMEVIFEFQQMVVEDMIVQGISKVDCDKYEVVNLSWMSVVGLFCYWKK